MPKIRRLFAQAPIDPYLLMLIGTVALAATLPAQGAFRPIVDGSVYGAVATLFFLYGARLSPEAVWAGIAHWRLQSLVFASTFALFPLVGVATMAAIGSSLPRDLTIGLMFLTLLPSTVQSSIAFTSIARGNVPAALCSASLSNLVGDRGDAAAGLRCCCRPPAPESPRMRSKTSRCRSCCRSRSASLSARGSATGCIAIRC